MFDGSYKTVDLSVGIEPGAPSEPYPAEVDYFDHEEGAERLAENLRGLGFDVEAGDFPGGEALAWEEVHAITHAATHVDAPWHYGPETAGEEARRIDELPLDRFHGDAVVLDFTDAEPGHEIAAAEVESRLEALGHELSAGDIVLLHTGADELWGEPDYLTEFPGMGAEATKHLVERGVRVVGTDAYGFDKPFAEMARRYAESGDAGELWPAHFAGREVDYCQIEKMANLGELPPTGAYVVAFPVVVEDASAGWVRPVAFVPTEDGDTGVSGA